MGYKLHLENRLSQRDHSFGPQYLHDGLNISLSQSNVLIGLYKMAEKDFKIRFVIYNSKSFYLRIAVKPAFHLVTAMITLVFFWILGVFFFPSNIDYTTRVDSIGLENIFHGIQTIGFPGTGDHYLQVRDAI